MEERGKPPEYDLLGLNSGVHTEAAMRNIDNRRIVQSLVAALDKIKLRRQNVQQNTSNETETEYCSGGFS